MTDIENFEVPNDQIKCVDDVPEAARLADRQQFLNRWYRPVAMAPFAVFLFIDFKFFPNSNNWLVVGIGLATLVWAVGVAGYAFYLLTTFKCPKCHERFGLGEVCKSCNLPRHGSGLESLDLSTFKPLK
jgi:hypothetical protein